MANSILTSYGVEHPAPFAGAVPKWLQFSALLAPPIAWFVELCVDYGLTSQACFPREHLLANGIDISPQVWPGSFALIIGALVIALLASAASFWMWIRTRNEVANLYGLIEGAEGPTRFLAVWGFWVGIWFALQVLFGAIGFLAVSACGS